jgi:Flp pilus assembly protein TadG
MCARIAAFLRSRLGSAAVMTVVIYDHSHNLR